MQNLSKEFGPFDSRIWLNTAHQGPLPKKAVAEVQEALKQKITPHLISDDSFFQIPSRLKQQLGKLMGIPGKDIILGNSATYGIHILAHGIPFKDGDEVLLVQGDFPASIVSWLYLEKKGIIIRFIKPSGKIIQADELRKEIKSNTRVFCTSWVNSFNGYTIDISQLGEICQANDTYFIVNGSQIIGAKSIDVSKTPVDAITSCGCKWLCGPYGTGFCWIKPELRAILLYNQDYWLTLQSDRPLNRMRTQKYNLKDDSSASKYDIFATANFFNFMPWIESIRLLVNKNINKVEAYNLFLTNYIINNLDYDKYTLISSQNEKTLSTLVIITHKKRDLNSKLYELLKKEGIDISLREGNIRISPHIFNTVDEVDQLLAVLKSC